MRYFIALEIPETNRRQIKLVQEDLENIIPGLRLTDNDKLHITIAFVGDQPETLQAALGSIIHDAVRQIEAFELTPSYLDAFPKLHNPHTFWIGVKGDVDKLFIIQERIKDGLAKLGVDVDERRYIPHIAIAKLSSLPVDEYLEDTLEDMMQKKHFDPIKVTSICLFESIPEGGFHTHNTLAKVAL